MKVLTPRLRMDEWANSLKELEMLLPPTSGGSVTGVCFITKNVQIVCGENTAEYTRYIFTIYTASLVLQTKAIRRFVITEKAPTAAFNQEKALVGAFSVITNLRIAFV